MTLTVQVLGAGIIGLSIADELARRGHRVEVCDPAPEQAVSYVAAGMLSPASETWHGEEELLSLGRRSLDLWPGYADRLGVALHRGGTLLVAVDAGDRDELERHRALLDVEALDRRRLRDLEPGLGPGVGTGLRIPWEQSVDPRAVLHALHARVPVSQVPAARADVTVVATGARLPEGLGPVARYVRGVRGEIVRVRTDDPPRHTLRGWVRGEPVYLVPRADGTGDVLVGATSEEHEGPPKVTVEGVHRLLSAAAELYPSLRRAELVEARAGDRPSTPDHLPLVGPLGPSADTAGTAGSLGDRAGAGDVVVAAGHFRHGVLLAPLTAALVADHLETGRVEPSLDPRRFVDAPEGRVPVTEGAG